MLDEKQKLKTYIEEEIQRVSNIQIEELDHEIETIRKETIANLEEDAQNEAGLLRESELREMQSDFAIKVSRLREEQSRKLMQKRKELNEEIFAEVKKQLLAFCESKDYETMLVEKLTTFAKEYPNRQVDIHYATKDEAYRNTMMKAYGEGCHLVCDDQIMIGGFLLTYKEDGIVIDETFDTALEDQREWFFANSGLFIK